MLQKLLLNAFGGLNHYRLLKSVKPFILNLEQPCKQSFDWSTWAGFGQSLAASLCYVVNAAAYARHTPFHLCHLS